MALEVIKECLTNFSVLIWKKLVSFCTCCISSGITTHEDLSVNVPLWESRTQIIWSSNNIDQSSPSQDYSLLSYLNMPATNTKSVIVSFLTLQGKPLQNVFSSTDSNLEAEVWLESEKSRVKIEANVAQPNSSAVKGNINASNNKIQIIFSGQRVGKYTVILRSNGQIVRGFPFIGFVVPGRANHRTTSLVENRSPTLLITAHFLTPETIRVMPKDKFGNQIKDPEELEKLSGKNKRTGLNNHTRG